ncbi:hypothetical protein FGIG_00032 [Fasciola gigantica]|uniref:Uncharacterized protein n=1 Tax=Fasciola gigantica TaxID=46835 RepID=A0A504XPS8_FASGI|nr:hypothetical protein FGIG_00032 [Fasciola gigantica]
MVIQDLDNLEEGQEITIESKTEEFKLLSREDILIINDTIPKWRRVRIGLLIGFWVVWLALLLALILIVVLQPKCPRRPTLNFWQSKVGYALDPFSFKDTNKDFIGDLNGVKEKLSYFGDDLDVGFVIFTALSDGYVDTSSGKIGGVKTFSEVDSKLGTGDDLKLLLSEFRKREIRVIVPVDMSAKVNGTDNTLFDELLRSIDSKEGKQELEKKITDVTKNWMTLGANGVMIKGIPVRENYDLNNKRLTTEVVWNATQNLIAAVRTVTDAFSFSVSTQRVLIIEPLIGDDVDSPTEFETYLLKQNTDTGAHLILTTRMIRAKSIIDSLTYLNQTEQLSTAYPTGIPSAPRTFDLIRMVLSFLSRGTPIIYFGSEVGFKCENFNQVTFDKLHPKKMSPEVTLNPTYLFPMPWDLSGVEFTGEEQIVPEFQAYMKTCGTSETVLSSQASGRGTTNFKLIQSLIQLKKEPSILWGSTTVKTFPKRVTSTRLQLVVRAAKDFPAFAVAINNPDIPEADGTIGSVIDLSDICSTMKVRLVHPSTSDISEGSVLHSQHIYIPSTAEAAIYVFECET